MIDKSINNIDCVVVRAREEMNKTMESMDDHDLIYNATYINAYNGSEVIKITLNESLSELEDQVCQAEVDSQVLDSSLNVWTSPFGKFKSHFNYSHCSYS